jgi:hypothetical protein
LLLSSFSVSAARQKVDLAEFIEGIEALDVLLDVPDQPVGIMQLPGVEIPPAFYGCENAFSGPPEGPFILDSPIPLYFSTIASGDSLSPAYSAAKTNTLLGDGITFRQKLIDALKTELQALPVEQIRFDSFSNSPTAKNLRRYAKGQISKGLKTANAAMYIQVRLFFNSLSGDPLLSRLWMVTQIKLFKMPRTSSIRVAAEKKQYKSLFKQRLVSNVDLRSGFEHFRKECPDDVYGHIASVLYQKDGGLLKQSADAVLQSNMALLRQHFVSDPAAQAAIKKKEAQAVYFVRRHKEGLGSSEANCDGENENFSEAELQAFWQSLTKYQKKRLRMGKLDPTHILLTKRRYFQKMDAKVLSVDKQQVVFAGFETIYAFPSEDALVPNKVLLDKLAASVKAFLKN